MTLLFPVLSALAALLAAAAGQEGCVHNPPQPTTDEIIDSFKADDKSVTCPDGFAPLPKDLLHTILNIEQYGEWPCYKFLAPGAKKDVEDACTGSRGQLMWFRSMDGALEEPLDPAKWELGAWTDAKVSGTEDPLFAAGTSDFRFWSNTDFPRKEDGSRVNLQFQYDYGNGTACYVMATSASATSKMWFSGTVAKQCLVYRATRSLLAVGCAETNPGICGTAGRPSPGLVEPIDFNCDATREGRAYLFSRSGLKVKISPLDKFCNHKIFVEVGLSFEIDCHIKDHYCEDNQFVAIKDHNKGRVLYCAKKNGNTKKDSWGVYDVSEWQGDIRYDVWDDRRRVVQVSFWYPDGNYVENSKDYCIVKSPDYPLGELDPDCGAAPSSRSLHAEEQTDGEQDDGEMADRIVGPDASPAGQTDLPFMALLKSTIKRVSGGNNIVKSCAGTLIHKKFVMTAAQCVDVAAAVKSVSVVICMGLVTRTREPDRKCVIEQTATEVFVHDDFVFGTSLNDIALVKLPRTIASFGSRIRPVCLAVQQPYVSAPGVWHEMTVAGWGRYSQTLNALSPNLRKGVAGVVEPGWCYHSSDYKVNCISPIYRNTGRLQGLPCTGDYGGFVGEVGKSGKYIQYGIHSSGLRTNPSNENGPKLCDIYVTNTDVSSYLGWIKFIVAENE